MQGFMVHVNAASGSLTIDADDRTFSTTSWFKESPANSFKLTAVDMEGNTAQECVIRIVDDATQGFDEKYDSHFLPGYAPQFYAVAENYSLSTNALPPLSVNQTIPLNFINNGASHFSINAEGIDNLDPQKKVFLKDLKTNYTQLLNSNPVYEFTSTDADNPQRFELFFTPLSIDENPDGSDINIFSVNKRIEIRANENMDAVIMVYSITGQLLTKRNMKNQKSASIDMKDFTGIAVVSVIETKKITTRKVILR